MFLRFLFFLREKGIPVTLHEWLLLMKALAMNLHESSLEGFYTVSRVILVKDVEQYRKFDEAFFEFFSQENLDVAGKMLETGSAEGAPGDRHGDGGNKAQNIFKLEVPTAEGANQDGKFKAGGAGFPLPGVGNESGLYMGSASKIPFKRRYRNYSDDEILDTRRIKVALSKLRKLLPESREVVDIPKTVERTCELGGELDLVFTKELTKKVKLLLLMDSGGSMDPHYKLVSRLFSAARSLFKDMKSYTFHNCIYQDLWIDIEKDMRVETEEVLRATGKDYKLIIVGDAAMAPGELFEVGGAIDMDYHNPIPGIKWLKRLRESFPDSIWLNPLPEHLWDSIESVKIISDIFPMFPLTLQGLEDGTKKLLRGTKWIDLKRLRLQEMAR